MRCLRQRGKSIKSPGAIRVTVTVMVNGTSGQGCSELCARADRTVGTVDLPLSLGYDEERGDVITLKSLSFEPLETLGSLPAEPGWFAGQLDTMSLVQIVVLAVVALVLGLFVVRPLLLPSRRLVELPAPVKGQLGLGSASDLPVLNGVIEPDDSKLGLPVLAEPGSQLSVPSTEDAVARLKTLIDERRSETVEVLRSWLDEPKAEDAR